MTTITLTGRATADAELRFTSSGKAVAEINVADNHRKKSPSGEWVDDGTTFYRVTAWEHLAEQMAERVKRGQRVVIIGELRNREYEHDGEKRRSLEIRAYEVAVPLDKWPPRDGATTHQPPAADPWASTGGATSANQEPPF